jgi:hypothetical protein
MLRLCGIVTTVVDEVLVRIAALAKVISGAETRH